MIPVEVFCILLGFVIGFFTAIIYYERVALGLWKDGGKQMGLLHKYNISKKDGSPIDKQAQYFVLRLDTDEAARFACLEYARFTKDTQLANNLRKWVLVIDPNMEKQLNEFDLAELGVR